MSTLARSVYLDAEFGVEQELPKVGSALENPFVFDASARELKAMADEGLIEIIDERSKVCGGEPLLDQLRFRRVR